MSAGADLGVNAGYLGFVFENGPDGLPTLPDLSSNDFSTGDLDEDGDDDLLLRYYDDVWRTNVTIDTCAFDGSLAEVA